MKLKKKEREERVRFLLREMSRSSERVWAASDVHAVLDKAFGPHTQHQVRTIVEHAGLKRAGKFRHVVYGLTVKDARNAYRRSASRRIQAAKQAGSAPRPGSRKLPKDS